MHKLDYTQIITAVLTSFHIYSKSPFFTYNVLLLLLHMPSVCQLQKEMFPTTNRKSLISEKTYQVSHVTFNF